MPAPSRAAPAPGRTGGALRDLWPAGGIALGVLLATTLPIAGPEAAPEGTDLAVHVAMFLVLAAALAHGWRRRGWRHPILGPALVGTVYGGVLELVQVALPHRGGDPLDAAANAVGALLGALAVARRRPPSAA